MPRFSDKAHAIRDLDNLTQTELIFEWLFDSSDTDECSSNEDKEDGVLIEPDDIAIIQNSLLNNRYLLKRVSIEKDTNHAGRLFNGNPRTFQTLFRMSKGTFNYLLEAIQGDPVFEDKSTGRKQIECRIQLGIFLYRCGDSGSGVRVATHFGVSEGTVFRCIARVILALLRLWKSYVKWPEPGSIEYKGLKNAIAEQSPYFEGCVGFVDGSEINLREKPLLDGESYFSRKKKYGINLQAVCDHERRFTFVSCGFPQSVGDVTAWKATRMYNHPENYFHGPGDFLIGDKGYVISRRMIIPYSKPLEDQQQGGYTLFNSHLTKSRVKIEHAFGILKSRLPILTALPIRIKTREDHQRAIRLISACIVVHNFALGHGDYGDFITLEEDELEGSEDNTIRGINEHINEQDGNLGKTMRDQIRMKIWEDRL
jgi:hypothetical protein